MTDEINKWINGWKKLFNYHNEYIGQKTRKMHVVPSIYCKDGFNVSIQASSGHYCNPRNENRMLDYNFDDSNEIHTSFELGFPSEKEDLILEYAEEQDNPTETVYGYVPLETVLKMIEKHGGIDYKKSLYNQFEKGVLRK